MFGQRRKVQTGQTCESHTNSSQNLLLSDRIFMREAQQKRLSGQAIKFFHDALNCIDRAGEDQFVKINLSQGSVQLQHHHKPTAQQNGLVQHLCAVP